MSQVCNASGFIIVLQYVRSELCFASKLSRKIYTVFMYKIIAFVVNLYIYTWVFVYSIN